VRDARREFVKPVASLVIVVNVHCPADARERVDQRRDRKSEHDRGVVHPAGGLSLNAKAFMTAEPLSVPMVAGLVYLTTSPAIAFRR
jgi:hypothetical protein